MTPLDLATILSAVPEKRLKLFDMARACRGPDGALDLATIASLTGELDDATDEASAYITTVMHLRSAFARLLQP